MDGLTLGKDLLVRFFVQYLLGTDLVLIQRIYLMFIYDVCTIILTNVYVPHTTKIHQTDLLNTMFTFNVCKQCTRYINKITIINVYVPHRY